MLGFQTSYNACFAVNCLWCAAVQKLDEESIDSMIGMVEKATHYAPKWPKAWRELAVCHLDAVLHLSHTGAIEELKQHVAPAVRGFFQALRLSQDDAHWMRYTAGPSKDTYQVELIRCVGMEVTPSFLSVSKT